jgi:hypothetical protein
VREVSALLYQLIGLPFKNTATTETALARYPQERFTRHSLDAVYVSAVVEFVTVPHADNVFIVVF